MKQIVLGYDGSDFSVQALDWALDEAELRKLPLTVAHAWQWPYGQAEEEAKAHLRKAAEHVLWHGADCARRTSSGVAVETDLHEGPAAERLVKLSQDAALVVVGSRGLSALSRAVVGSVAEYVAAHAGCPVIVVRGPGPLPAATRPGPVVVAEPAPDAAVLEFASEEAALRRLPLSVSATSASSGWAARHPGVRLQPVADHGAASLMVVGRRRATRAGIAAFLLQHAPCPVAVVG
ncbi:universal stress protein [Nonomuraea sp. FMUSA5-5]|uniref:Universal stress protein n=1 Tax=Nonomuraea composti TaxID=2720023 RepID=A0ABX1AX50_9ACTN|nr:universal stress protein [Nonomuraea sp. FMUSA5-5]NJP88747.1 universal stress protein [Nonomuraea sp. FMUSA5-5]